eukprot:NODE_626_length_1478_cov_237.204339_g470_i0.p1 GENE.NODE_626_length_1478_cov_237.204339_g470_i0~~NODE_626_length_1478_cov_237.204339_g470_i0.p1  ORF type:complete len:238 (-),score=42.09 NODE_626_length_1478_cov_237.204339_g470_i0:663-1376(-)
MGCGPSQDIRMKTTLHQIDKQVHVESWDANNYIEHFGFITRDRFIYNITFTDSPTWSVDTKDKMSIKIGDLSQPVDLRKYVAHKIGVLNHLNKVSKWTATNFLMTIEDKTFHSVLVEITRASGEKSFREVDIGINIKGDRDFQRLRTGNPDAIEPVRDSIAYALPDHNHITNSVKIMNGRGKRFSGVPDLGGTEDDTPQLDEFSHDDLQKEINKFYQLYHKSSTYKTLQSLDLTSAV